MAETQNEFVKFIEEGIEFVKRMGIKAVKMEPRYIKLLVPLQGNSNHIGTMYAGALFTLAELPGGAIFLTTFDVSRYYPIVREMTIKFKRPVVTDATVEVRLTEAEVAEIKKTVEEKGKANFTLKGEILNAAGELSAESIGIYQLRAIGI